MLRLWTSFMSACGWCYLYTGMVLIIVFPVIAVACLSIGAVFFEKVVGTPWLLSVPLCPIGSFPYKEFIGAGIPDSGLCSSSTAEFTVQVPVWLIANRDVEHTMFLVHNLWNYDIDMAVCSGSCEDPSIEFAVSRIEGPSSSELRGAREDGFLPSDFFDQSNHARVYCPNSTLETVGRERTATCQSANGDYFRLKGGFEKIEIGRVKYSELQTDQTRLVFKSVRVTPRNFIELPQLFWFSRCKSGMNSVLIAGIVMLVLSVALPFLWVLGVRVVQSVDENGRRYIMV
jgi:hypothetical protein